LVTLSTKMLNSVMMANGIYGQATWTTRERALALLFAERLA